MSEIWISEAVRKERAELMMQAREARESGSLSGRRLARRLEWMADVAGLLGRIAGRLEEREAEGKGVVECWSGGKE